VDSILPLFSGNEISGRQDMNQAPDGSKYTVPAHWVSYKEVPWMEKTLVVANADPLVNRMDGFCGATVVLFPTCGWPAVLKMR
jgi:hypothetical protein